jgi:DNA-directed RNA polymerase specialized sigma24 family protein
MESLSMDMGQETDAGLLVLMGAAGSSADEQEMARAALRELHRRYYPYVYTVLDKFSENVGTVIIDPAEFAVATFSKAFRAAESFRDQSNGDTETAKLQVKAWLGVIASNLAKDALDRVSRHRKEIELVPLDDAHDVAERELQLSDTTSTAPVLLSALQSAMDALKPEEKDILITYATFGIPTKNGRELPSDVRDALEQRTGYERSNIRQKWLRLSRRLKAELEPCITPQKVSNQ